VTACCGRANLFRREPPALISRGGFRPHSRLRLIGQLEMSAGGPPPGIAVCGPTLSGVALMSLRPSGYGAGAPGAGPASDGGDYGRRNQSEPLSGDPGVGRVLPRSYRVGGCQECSTRGAPGRPGSVEESCITQTAKRCLRKDVRYRMQPEREDSLLSVYPRGSGSLRDRSNRDGAA
jgi:hypothetical protein